MHVSIQRTDAECSQQRRRDIEQLLRMEDIYRSFSEVRVLNKAKLELRQGEVCALPGGNGAGKSTLIRILGSVYTRNGGETYVNGRKADITDMKDTKKYGIKIIYQELMSIPYMTIAENIFLGQGPRTRLGTVDTSRMNSETAKFLAEMELSFKPTDLVGKLNITQQRMIEIMGAISFGTEIIIMDESTPSLMDTEVGVLFEAIRRLKEDGVGIIYINHRVSGLDITTDQTTVIRDGEYVGTMVTKETNHDRLVSLMVGRSPGDLYKKRYHATDEVVLKIEHLLSGRGVRDVTFDSHKGEVLDLSGLVGSGYSEAMKCISGFRKKEKGRIYISGKEAKVNNVRDAMRYGIGLVPEDGKKGGVYAIQGIRFNTTTEVLREFLKNGRYDRDKELALTKEYVDDIIQTKYAGMERPIGRFSGGNQQEVIINRWLLTTKNILIPDEPTRGIDVRTKSDVYHLIDRLTAQGLPTIFISSEMPELISICDRIVVMNQGYTTDVLEREEFSQERITSLATMELQGESSYEEWIWANNEKYDQNEFWYPYGADYPMFRPGYPGG